jgi:hypothetical protein
MEDSMMRALKLSVIAATAALTVIPVVVSQPANAQIYIGNAPPNQQPPRYGAWGDRDRDGIPNQYDRNNNYNNSYNNNRRGRGDQDRDGIANRYDTDRDGDGTPNRWDRNPANPHRR